MALTRCHFRAIGRINKLVIAERRWNALANQGMPMLVEPPGKLILIARRHDTLLRLIADLGDFC